MGWESRKKGRVFYRAKKVDGRVVKTYFGRGMAARMAADRLAEDRRLRVERAAAIKAEEARLETPTSLLDDLDDACSLMVEATLTAAGYHKVDFKWRKKRVRDKT